MICFWERLRNLSRTAAFFFKKKILHMHGIDSDLSITTISSISPRGCPLPPLRNWRHPVSGPYLRGTHPFPFGMDASEGALPCRRASVCRRAPAAASRVDDLTAPSLAAALIVNSFASDHPLPESALGSPGRWRQSALSGGLGTVPTSRVGCIARHEYFVFCIWSRAWGVHKSIFHCPIARSQLYSPGAMNAIAILLGLYCWRMLISRTVLHVHAYPSQNVFFANNVNSSTRAYGIATNLSSYPSGNVDKTISFWFKQPPGLSFPDVQGILSIFMGPDFPAYPCTTEELSFFQRTTSFQAGGACGVRNHNYNIGASNAIWYESWNFFAYSFVGCGQSCGQGQAYLNGEYIGSFDGAISRSGTNIMLGSVQGYYMTLYLDDLRVWSRTLNASEINKEFFSSTPQASALRIWYNFDTASIGAASSSDIVSGAVMNLYNGASIVSLSSAGCNGHYHVSGSISLLPCSSGTFCTTCVCAQACSSPGICQPGSYCPGGSINGIACPIGSYCPSHGASIPTPCPYGTFGASMGLTAANCTGPCSVGYLCLPGSNSSTPQPCPGFQSCAAMQANCGTTWDSCNNVTVTCGPTCYAPLLLSWIIDSVDTTHTVRVMALFNQTIRVRPSASELATATTAGHTLSWRAASNSANQPNPAVFGNPALLGCRAVANNGARSLSFLQTATTMQLSSFDGVLVSNLWDCNNAAVILGNQSAIIWNGSTLILDIPTPTLQAGTLYTITLPVGSWCSAMQPQYCSSTSFVTTITTPADTMAFNLPLNLAVDSSNTTNLVLRDQPASSVATWSVSGGAVSVNVTFVSALPRRGPYVAWLVPTDSAALQQALPPAATPLIGATTWHVTGTTTSMPATAFADRYLLLPANGANATARYMPNCTLVTDIILQCQLPVNASSSLWRFVVDWVYAFPDGSWAVRRPLTPFSVMSSASSPLTITFPLPTLDVGSLRRFLPNSQGTGRSISTPFVANDAAFEPVFFSGSHVALQAVPQVPEPLFVKGVWAAWMVAFDDLAVFVGGPLSSVTLPCSPMQPTSATWLVCYTTALPSATNGINLPLHLWDSTSLVIATSLDTYTYQYTLAVYSLSGCGPAGLDTSDVRVNTTACPCAGSITMTVIGFNLFPPLTITIGGGAPLAVGNDAVDNNRTSFQFTLPKGSGLQLSLTVRSGSSERTLLNALSYSLPNITGLVGCNAASPVAQIQQCNRTGGDLVTIFGSNFGQGVPNVLVAGKPCRLQFPLQSNIVCVLPPMPIDHALGNQVIVVQSTGGLTIADLAVASISYRQCPPGKYEADLACVLCAPGTYSAQLGSTSCSSCPVGTVASSAAGMSSCMPCGVGTYANGQTVNCVPCLSGFFSASTQASACTECPTIPATFSRVGASLCTPCQPNSATRASACVCNPQYFLSGNASRLGMGDCAFCPKGASCLGPDDVRTVSNLASQPGYWRVLSTISATPVFMACPMGTNACPSSFNGRCVSEKWFVSLFFFSQQLCFAPNL
jgi:hypothetical protein